MITRIPLFMLALMPCMISAAQSATPYAVQTIKGRIAFSTDGNMSGNSDLMSTPLAIALLKKANQSNKIVYIDTANHYWANSSTSTYSAYKNLLNQTVAHYGLDADIVYDVSDERSAAKNALVKEINKSTSANPLNVFLNGPADHLCAAVKMANVDARAHVTVYTHGRADAELTVNGSCNMAELLKVKPKTVKHVAYPAFGSLLAPSAQFTWLSNSEDTYLKKIRSGPGISVTSGNIRDAGSVFATLTGDRAPTPAKFAALFGNAPSEPGKPADPVDPDPIPVTPPLASGDLATVLSDSCYNRIWNPANSSMGIDKWAYQRAGGATHAESTGFDKRASYVTNAPGGVDAVRFVSYGDKWNSLLDYKKGNAKSFMPAAGMESARFVASYHIPSSYDVYRAGRLPVGFIIGDPNGKITGMSGGTVPEKQQGSSVRINFSKSLSLMIYSYHLNRKSERFFWTSPLAGGGSGERQFGTGPRTPNPLPKGEWATMVLDVTLNEVGKTNGTSRLRLYNSQGKLFSSALLENAQFRKDSKWKITGPYMTEKYDNLAPGPKTQYMYARNFNIYNKSSNCQ